MATAFLLMILSYCFKGLKRLSGKELGKNRLGDVDTMQRYIYIHGVPDHYELGSPRSIGCVNMFNTDILDLFDRVEVGTEVCIN